MRSSQRRRELSKHAHSLAPDQVPADVLSSIMSQGSALITGQTLLSTVLYISMDPMSLLRGALFSVAFVCAFGAQAAMPDWKEDGNTVACVWAKDIPGGRFVPGKGAPTVTLYVYADQRGKELMTSLVNDRRPYLGVEKRGQFVKLKLAGDDAHLNQIIGWVKVDQLQFGALRNCA